MLLRASRSVRKTRRLFSHRLSTSSEPEEENYDFGLYDVILPAEPFVFGVSHIQPRQVPLGIQRPRYARTPPEVEPESPRIILGSQDETRVRNAASLARMVRDYAGSLAKPGITTDTIDKAAHSMIISHSAYPSSLLFNEFPRSICTSINNVVAHGIPDDRPLQDGDIINIDVTVYLDGFHGDTSRTFLVGDVDMQGKDLVNATEGAVEAGIQACGPGQPYRNIGKAIHDYIVTRSMLFPLCISPQFTGHGIGTVFHKRPWIVHTVNEEPERMVPGDCFTIEPPIIQGSNSNIWIFPDGWTASTLNCARAAQAEDQILITDKGVDILTR